MRVTKRDGTQEEYQVGKIKRVIEWACEDLDVEPVELETGLDPYLTEGVSTEFLHKQLISNAKQLISPDEPDWNLVAGKLLMQDIWKKAKLNRGYGYDLRNRLNNYKYNPAVYTYSGEEIATLNSHIDIYRDFLFDYAGAYYLTTKYLLKDELPQEMWMINAMILMSSETYDTRIEKVIQLYDYLSRLQISLATPILLNLREPEGNCSSCFIVSVDDDLDSIYHNLTNTARISKNAGGVGVNLSKIRGLGSYIQNVPNASGGVLPWIKLFNDTAIAVNQKGKRPGAVTVALDSWHIDIESFIEVNSEVGDFRVKSPDVFPQVVVSDEYMRRVENDEDWTLVDPHEVLRVYGVDITELWGDEFTTFYNKITSENKLTLTSTLKAKDLFKEIIRSQHDTGLPYIFFKDTANRYNSDRETGYIPNANLCVAPETKILTKQGQIPIGELGGCQVDVWNGKEWSEVTVRKTGKNRELVKVTLSNGEYVECTPEHGFWVQNGYRKKPVKVEAKDLNAGDKLIKYNLPVVSSDSDVDFPYAYTSGFFTGDGSYSGKQNQYPEIDLYGEKKNLLPHIAVRNKLHSNGSTLTELSEVAVYDDIKQDRIVCKLPVDIPPKFTVPLNGYTVKSRLEWLAGLLDSDGTVSRGGNAESLSISSIDLSFLREVRWMLQTLGVDSFINLARSEGFKSLPNGKGGKSDYFCQQSYRLLINSVGLAKLAELGLVTYRLKWTYRIPKQQSSRYIQVCSVEHTGRVSDVFCFTEHKRNLGMFNGVLLSNCVESFSNVSSEASHVCNLSSLVLANLEDSQIETATRLCVRLLDNLIDLTEEPVQEAKNHNQKYRTIGIGAMGLADWLALKGKNYYTGIDLASNLFEDISYYAASESSKIASIKGSFGTYSSSSWSKGEMFGRPLYDLLSKSYSKDRWIKLSKEIEHQGMRNSKLLAIAPNCQDPNNKVQTSEGVFSIYEILISQGFNIEEIEGKEPHWIDLKTPVKVPTLEGDDVCERIWYNGQHPTVSIEFEDGNVYTYTLNHKLLVEREYHQEWVECEKLKLGDVVSIYGELGMEIKSLTINEPTTTYDFEVKNHHHYFMENGVVSHNTSTSLLMGCTASILPPVAKVLSVTTGDGSFNIPCKYLKTHRFHYIANKDTDQKVIVQLVSKIQTWVCQGISMELVFDKNSEIYSPKYVYEVLMEAWKRECKTVYYIRWVEKRFKEACESCAG